MHFINEDNLKNISYDNYPFPHTIVENFLKNDVLDNILLNINNLKDENANSKFINPSSPYEYNKYAFSSNYGDYLKKLFI
jgi:hypothetical protein